MDLQEGKRLVESVRRAEDAYNEMMMSPERYTAEERDEIALDAQASAAIADAAMKEHFSSLSLENQDRMLDLLALESGLGRRAWEELLT